jgi:hypothetical protein
LGEEEEEKKRLAILFQVVKRTSLSMKISVLLQLNNSLFGVFVTIKI